jgi:hypothetical protein
MIDAQRRDLVEIRLVTNGSGYSGEGERCSGVIPNGIPE